MDPAIIEVALNGETRPGRNPHAPRTPGQIAQQGIACLGAGATILHTHIDDPFATGAAAADAYGNSWRPIRERFPQAVLCPTMAAGTGPDARIAHFSSCVRDHGAAMVPLDPGSMNMPLRGGAADEQFVLSYVNSWEHIGQTLALAGSLGAGVSFGIYEPGFLRAVVGFHHAGKVPPGSLVKFYFFGGGNMFDGRTCTGFGLSPGRAALDAYLEILDGTGLAWSVAVLGGCVVRSGMARLALDRGGHVRVGLEDYAGPDTPTNCELLHDILGIVGEAGRRPATPTATREILGLR